MQWRYMSTHVAPSLFVPQQNAATGIQGGRMTSPQDQTATPLPTDPVVSAPGETITCQVESASDLDRMTHGSYSTSVSYSVTYT